MAEYNLKLNINGVETAIASIEDLEVALKATKEEMSGLQIGSEAFNIAANNAQKLDSQLKNIKLSTEGADTKKVAQSFAKLGEVVAGSFAIATNAMGVFGVENEQVAAAAQKAQSAIAVVMGARAVAEGLVEGRIAARLIIEKVAIANAAILAAFTTQQAVVSEAAAIAVTEQVVATEALAVADGQAVVATEALNVVMNLNPILLIVTAIGALIAAFTLLGNAEEEEIERNQRLNAIRIENVKRIDADVAAIRDALDVKVKASERELELLKAQGAGADVLLAKEQDISRQKQYILSYIHGFRGDLNAKELEEEKDLQNHIKVVAAQSEQDKLKILEDGQKAAAALYAKRLEDYKKSLQDLKDVTTEASKSLIDITATTEKEKLDLEKARAILSAEETHKIAVDAAVLVGKDTLEIEQQYTAAKNAISLEFEEKERQLVARNTESKFAELTKLTNIIIASEEERIARTNKAKLDSLEGDAVIAEKANQARVKAEQDVNANLTEELNAYRELKKQGLINDDLFEASIRSAKVDAEIELQDILKVIDDNARDEKARLDEEQRKKDYDGNIKSANDSLNLAQSLTTSLSALSNLYFSIKNANITKGSAAEEKAARNQFKINKALNLVGAVLDTAKAAIASLAQAPLAIGPIPSPIGIASLAAVVLTGAASIAKIAATQFNGPFATPAAPASLAAGAAAGGDSGASNIIQSSGGGFTGFNPILAGTPTGGSTTGGAGTNGNQRVYVVESDITDAQRRVALAESNSTF